MDLKEDLKKALVELRKTEKRKFDQTVDLIINLQKYDLKKNPLNIFLTVPHKIKEKKIAANFQSINVFTLLKQLLFFQFFAESLPLSRTA